MRGGNWVELGHLGAYGAYLRSRLNGFARADLVELADPPMPPTPGYD
jgi:diaminopimelate decarboxylase